MADPNIPKYTLDQFTVKNNYYVVEQHGKFHYFPIKANEAPPGSNFIPLTQKPPVLFAGKAIIGKQVFEMSLRDIMRGTIRKSTLVPSGKSHVIKRAAIAATATVQSSNAADATSADPGTPGPKFVSSTGAVPDPDERSSELGDLVEISQAADLAWKEQADALLQAIHSQEGGDWEIAGPA